MNHDTQAIQSVEWYTPPEVFTALGLEFNLDPCSPGAAVVPWIPTLQHFTRADDGLMQPWHGRVWLNPPYGKHTAVWLQKLANHGDGVALLLSRTDTEWFHRAASRADLVCFMRGRLRFFAGHEGMTTLPKRSTDNVAAGSVLFAFGQENAHALRRSKLGLCVETSGL